MQKFTIEYGAPMSRVEELRLMHETMISMNDEEAYMEWITYGVPDEPSDDDFIDIAGEDDLYEDACREFKGIFKRYRKYGLFDPTDEVLLFVYHTFGNFKVVNFAE